MREAYIKLIKYYKKYELPFYITKLLPYNKDIIKVL